MRARLLLWAALAAAPASAQFQLSIPQGDVERPVVSQYDFGLVPVGDVREVRFRARNISSSPATLTLMSLPGPVFTILDAPELPRHIESGAAFDFTVRFQPPDTGLYSSALRVNNLSPILRGTGRAGLAVFLDTEGTLTPLTSASTIDFGDVERKSPETRRVAVQNPSAERVVLRGVSVSDEFFHLGPHMPPESIGPGESAVFDITFDPAAVGERTGWLVIDERAIGLKGNGIEPPLPGPRITLEPNEMASAQQGKLSIRFDEAETSGTGRVTLEFRPATEGHPPDPAIIFPSTNSPSAGFSVAEGQSVARFGAREQIEFQTGTTAGTLVIKVELGSHNESVSIPLAAAPPGIDTTRGTRSASGVEVQVAGFDNTRSASQLTFTFYDQSGVVIGAGPVRADTRGEFQRYFQSSEAGGMFSLRAVFPVTGDTTRIGSAEVEITNSAGTAKSGRISF